VAYQSPFDQPTYRKTRKAKKKVKKAKARKKPAVKKAKARRVAKKVKKRVVKKAARAKKRAPAKAKAKRKAPARKPKPAPEPDAPTEFWRLDVTISESAVREFAQRGMTSALLRAWLKSKGVPVPKGARKPVLVELVVRTRMEEEGGDVDYPQPKKAKKKRAKKKATARKKKEKWPKLGKAPTSRRSRSIPLRDVRRSFTRQELHAMGELGRSALSEVRADESEVGYYELGLPGVASYRIPASEDAIRDFLWRIGEPEPEVLENPFPFPQAGGGLGSSHCVTYVGLSREGHLLPEKLLYCGSHDQCFMFLHKHQGQSVDWALKHGGYSIDPAPWAQKQNPWATNSIPEAGDRVELVEMPDDPCPIAPGSRGTVRSVQLVSLGGGMLGGTTTGGFFQIMVDWDHGRGLMLSIPPDRVRVIGKRNPAAIKRERQHVKNKPYEAFRKTVTPVLKKAERLLTKRSAGVIQEHANVLLERASSDMFSESARRYYVPLVGNLQAEFADTKHAAATMRARSTRQGAYDQAVKDFTRASWEIAENLLRASDLMKWEDKRLHKSFLKAFHDLTSALEPGRRLAANPSPWRWRVNPYGYVVPADRVRVA
jgi:hypothetical protein